MISMGPPKLDEFIGGGLPAGKSLLFEIEPGMEETDIAFHVMKENIGRANIVYVSSISSPKNVHKKLEEYGIKPSENFSIIDGYSSLVGAPSDEKYVVEEPHDIRSYEDVVLQAIYEKEGENTLVVFDSLSNIMDLCNEREALDGIERINNEAGKIGASLVYNFISWPYKESILYRIKRIFNGIIEARKEDALSVMEIKKIDWSNGERKKFYFGIFKPEGLRIYIPKIVVAGSPKSGKTSFIRAVSKKFSSVERLGTTAGVEYGVVDYNGYRAELFGMPGREEFMPLLEKLAGSSLGAIIVVDSSNVQSIEEAKKFMAKFGNMPCVVLANKQDMPGAMKKEEIAKMLQVNDVVEGNMITGQGAFETFLTLAEKIMEWLNAR